MGQALRERIRKSVGTKKHGANGNVCYLLPLIILLKLGRISVSNCVALVPVIDLIQRPSSKPGFVKNACLKALYLSFYAT
jgi:hypothetical protein